jgi:hypothetical protein
MKEQKIKTTLAQYEEEVDKIIKAFKGGYVSMNTAINLIMDIK